MSTKAIIGLLVGLALVIGLVAWQGLTTVAGLLAEAGWAILLICLFEPPMQWTSAEAWRCLFPRGRRPGAMHALWASWMGAAANVLLPLATIGGEVIKARVLTLWSYSPTDAISTMVIDKTVQAIVVLIWALVGIGMLAALAPGSAIITGALIGAVALGLGIAGFIAVQLRGSFGAAARLAGKVFSGDRWRGVIVGAEQLDVAIRAIYRRPGAIALSCVWRLAGRAWLVGEVLLAAHLMGYPVSLAEAILLKGLINAIRGVSFAVPAGLGLQEGGYVALGALLGLPADFMLALSLATRVRELAPSIPLLIAWQNVEGRALWRRRPAAEAAPASTPPPPRRG